MMAFVAQAQPEYPGGVLLFTFVIGLALAFIPARIASKKGRSAVAFYIFGVLFFLPTLIVALVIKSKTPVQPAYSPAATGLPAPPPPMPGG